jgi:hypothetical protein
MVTQALRRGALMTPTQPGLGKAPAATSAGVPQTTAAILQTETASSQVAPARPACCASRRGPPWLAQVPCWAAPAQGKRAGLHNGGSTRRVRHLVADKTMFVFPTHLQQLQVTQGAPTATQAAPSRLAQWPTLGRTCGARRQQGGHRPGQEECQGPSTARVGYIRAPLGDRGRFKLVTPRGPCGHSNSCCQGSADNIRRLRHPDSGQLDQPACARRCL